MPPGGMEREEGQPPFLALRAGATCQEISMTPRRGMPRQGRRKRRALRAEGHPPGRSIPGLAEERTAREGSEHLAEGRPAGKGRTSQAESRRRPAVTLTPLEADVIIAPFAISNDACADRTPCSASRESPDGVRRQPERRIPLRRPMWASCRRGGVPGAPVTGQLRPRSSAAKPGGTTRRAPSSWNRMGGRVLSQGGARMMVSASAVLLALVGCGGTIVAIIAVVYVLMRDRDTRGEG